MAVTATTNKAPVALASPLGGGLDSAGPVDGEREQQVRRLAAQMDGRAARCLGMTQRLGAVLDAERALRRSAWLLGSRARETAHKDARSG